MVEYFVTGTKFVGTGTHKIGAAATSIMGISLLH
jgi:hypothetical protein